MKKIISGISFSIALFLVFLMILIIVLSDSNIAIVSGNSMDSTLKNGQILFSEDTKQINRGDIVTFRLSEDPYLDENTKIVKRVIVNRMLWVILRKIVLFLH